eukprot:CAMPEP_0117655894 /NCGR_PEP_ID=MMETSP0804-20121206/4518_1 /TAXON_ID=1074897 /ORGANISM="Tetraselmis astigmatica, Strain CCMP880" /LENGTH=121 /DNA_ID=CAMNT_0005462267 /DNA_START=1086 /DNA_END=1451 /DNA_ORIENTATION=-
MSVAVEIPPDLAALHPLTQQGGHHCSWSRGGQNMGLAQGAPALDGAVKLAASLPRAAQTDGVAVAAETLDRLRNLPVAEMGNEVLFLGLGRCHPVWQGRKLASAAVLPLRGLPWPEILDEG